MKHRSHLVVPALLCAFGAALMSAVSVTSQQGPGQPAYRNAQLPVEQRVADLLSRMTLEEKVAQTHALWQRKALIMDEQGNFAPEKAKEVLKNGIGQITRASEKKGPRENAVFTNAIQKFLREQTRLGIPAMIHEESLHGFAANGATSFPQAIALASTWDPDLVEQAFGVAAQEIRSRGGQQALTPVLDLARDPRWGRVEETYGEDPYLVLRLGVACIQGFQGKGPGIDQQHIFATMKHFAVHGQPEAGTNLAPGNYSERIIRENFLVPFQAAVTEAGVMSVMPSYNEIDGVPSHGNPWLLQKVLREEWGFQGFVVSDYEGIAQLETLHHVVANRADAAKKALEAGVDIELPDVDAYGTLIEQVRAGRISEATLDKTVARILRAKFLAGLFEDLYVDPEAATRINNAPGHRELALKAAREAVVLLKNQNGALPLDRAKIRTLAVIGPNAAKCHLGGYSQDPGHCVTLLDGIKAKAGEKIKVVYAVGSRITEEDADWRDWYTDKVTPSDPAKEAKRIAEAVQTAKAADAIVLVLGGNEQTCREAWAESHPGDRDSLELLGQQNELVKAMLATGKPVVVFLINGRPLAINYLAENVPAILEGWYLGQEGGTAAAEALFGDYNPGGRLPITFPRSAGQIPAYYNHKPSARRGYLFADKAPLFPFGHGLSYTSFKYSNLRLSPDKIGTSGHTTVSVDVTNTGKVKGDEVVEMYIHDLVSSVTRPVKELKGFKRLTLEPGQTKTVELPITSEALSFLDANMQRIVEPGEFDIMVGPNSTDLQTVKLRVED
ncbi:MAG: glycoside hydrolase family 3 N-terminal domain-containing protein [Terriglobia bacterium]